jgi:hypothetical protein
MMRSSGGVYGGAEGEDDVDADDGAGTGQQRGGAAGAGAAGGAARSAAEFAATVGHRCPPGRRRRGRRAVARARELCSTPATRWSARPICRLESRGPDDHEDRRPPVQGHRPVGGRRVHARQRQGGAEAMEVADAVQARDRAVGPREGQGLPRGPHVLPAPAEEKEAPPPPKPTTLLFKDYAGPKWMNEYVVANRHSPATFEHRQKTLTRDLLPCSGSCRSTRSGRRTSRSSARIGRTSTRPPSTRSATSSPRCCTPRRSGS